MRKGSKSAGRRLAASLTMVGLMLLAGAGVALAASVGMVDDDFTPSSITVAAGESVTFTNNGDRPHTATADGGAFDTGTVDPGGSATVTLGTPGTYRYYCQFHGGPGGDGMSGTITVTGSGGSDGGPGGDGGDGGGGTTGSGTVGQTTSTGSGEGPGGETSLPQTASPLPLIGAAGAVRLVAGLWLGRRRTA